MKYFDPRCLTLVVVSFLISLPCINALSDNTANYFFQTPIDSITTDSITTDLSFDVRYEGCADDFTSSATVIAISENSLPPFFYVWSNGDTSRTAMNLTVGSYSVTLTDAANREFVDSVTIDSLTPLTITKTSVIDATCQGSSNGSLSVSINGGTPDYDLSWSTGADSANLVLLNPGQYFLTVTDASGCSIIDTTVIGQTNELSVEITEQLPASGPDIANGAATAQAVGGMAPYIYIWDNNIVGANNLNLAPGAHSVTVTDSIGCVANARFTTIFSELIVEIASKRDERCLDANDGLATVTTSDGIAPYTYLWSNGDTSSTARGLAAGTHEVTVTDAEGKIGETSVNIVGASPIFFNMEITPPDCGNLSNGWVRMAPTGGQEPYLYDIGIGITPVGIVGAVSYTHLTLPTTPYV